MYWKVINLSEILIFLMVARFCCSLFHSLYSLAFEFTCCAYLTRVDAIYIPVSHKKNARSPSSLTYSDLVIFSAFLNSSPTSFSVLQDIFDKILTEGSGNVKHWTQFVHYNLAPCSTKSTQMKTLVFHVTHVALLTVRNC